MSNEAVIRKKNDLCRQLLDHLRNAGVSDPDISKLTQSLTDSPTGSDTAVLSSAVIMKYKEKFNGDSAAVLKRWILLN